MAALAGGDFLVTGYTASFAETDDDPYIIRIGPAGEVRWTRVIPVDGVTHTLSGEQTADGGLLLGGFSDGRGNGTGRMAAILLKTDPDGHPLWRLEYLPTTTGESFGYTARATSDGGAVLAGHTTVGSAGGLDLFLVKVDRDGR